MRTFETELWSVNSMIITSGAKKKWKKKKIKLQITLGIQKCDPITVTC
jgi:hypothetical protein